MKLRIIGACVVIFGLVGPVAARAQAATIAFDYPATTPAATVQAWTARVYVNNTAFTLVDTCVLAGVAPNQVITCTATLPNIAAALTPSGNQTLEISLADPVVGEGPRSVPLVLVRPSASTAPRIQ